MLFALIFHLIIFKPSFLLKLAYSVQLTNSLFMLGNSYSLYITDRTFITCIIHSICREMNHWKKFIKIIDQMREEMVCKYSGEMIFCMNGMQLHCFFFIQYEILWIISAMPTKVLVNVENTS